MHEDLEHETTGEGPRSRATAAPRAALEAAVRHEFPDLDPRHEAAPEGYAIVTADGRLSAWNRRLFEVWAISEAEVAAITGAGPSTAAREALFAALLRRVSDPDGLRAARTASPEDTRVELISLCDGRFLERHTAPTRDLEARVTGRLSSFRDVTWRKHADAALRERARQQAAMASLGELAMNTQEVSPILLAACAMAIEVLAADAAAVLEPAPDRRSVFVRAAVGLAPGISGTAIEGPWACVVAALAAPASVAAEDAAARFGADPFLAANGIASLVAAALPGRERAGGVLVAFTRDRRIFTVGEMRFLEATTSVVAAAVARNHAEREVLQRERQLRAVFDAANDAMLVVDPGGAVLDANPAASTFFGARRAEILGRTVFELSGSPPDAERARAHNAELFGRGRRGGEWPFALPGRAPRWVEFSAVPELLPDRSLLVLRDVTERRQLQARLALADRLISVGTLAAGVAHELNNPLAFVSANLAFVSERVGRIAELVARAPAADESVVAQVDAAVREARDGAERMRMIIRDLKTFSRPDEETARAIDLSAVLESCIAMAWNEIRHRARLVRRLEPVPPVFGSEARFGQVFLNLLVNAAQSIPEGDAAAHVIAVSTGLAPDGRVAVEVRDDGCGIPADRLARIFDPFFTTKAPGVGTGLGLSICHSIVAAQGGEIEVESAPGHGTTFRVLLPPSDVALAARGAPAAAAPVRRGRILVVDDEPLVCSVLSRTLGTEHDVVVAERARAALDLLARGERFDVILSDLLMPEMTGMDLHRELRRSFPEHARRVVFLTGGAFTPAARAFLEEEAVECVEKPFDLATIRAAIARRLADR
jgi:PAS domain S-box-containing protein